ncbi:hypothetical protein GALL_473640 [mine drainage metagenome]|uniref:Uncharacterized protein n=1 Tax=mine drainage metagenome TaxID=410659 RepID=A0A1J5PTG1_9ZZZZ
MDVLWNVMCDMPVVISKSSIKIVIIVSRYEPSNDFIKSL